MKKPIVLLAIIVAGTSLMGQSAKKKNNKNNEPQTVLVTKEDSATYANGFQMGNYFRQNQIALNINAFMQGLKDAYNAEGMQISPQELEAYGQYFGTYVNQQMELKNQRDAEYNKKVGEIYMAQNRKSKEIVETASGLQYIVIKEGEGARPSANDKVKVHYVGTTLDGKEFDSSRKRGEPITFGLNQVIAGWTEGLQLMTPGSIYKFWIPSNLAYGDRPIGSIPPGSTLIFEVELLEVNPQ